VTTRWINSEVINCFLLRVPRKFEPSQTFVFLLGAPEMQFFRAVARQKLNALPHNKIIGAQCLKSFIGSAVFIKGVLSKAEKNCRGYWARPMLGENNETETAVYDMLVDVQEERQRLWRETVPPACLRMKVVKIIDGSAIAGDDCLYAAALCLADSPANWTGKASSQFLCAAGQIECMPIKFLG
jgi:hypothetical protein